MGFNSGFKGLKTDRYEDGTECSETSAYKIQTPGNYLEESVQHSEHGESLKSITKYVISVCNFVAKKITFPKMFPSLIVYHQIEPTYLLTYLFQGAESFLRI